MAPLELFPFRFRDAVSGKWQRARYVATLADIESRYAEWEIIGPAELRSDDPVKMFQPHTPAKVQRTELGPELATIVDGLERVLVSVFLRRYVTWCARRRRFAQMQGAARLFRDLAYPGDLL